ncbi:MAG: hypothetical protein EOO07_30855 [Chitinophagaceae bacterium]|nr:MAG: hypothetical protein EOO07_30855 [Chitinophagaceae bacterium]
MPNIKLSYLYRDGGNYKKFGNVVFNNPDNIEIGDLNSFIKSNLIDGMWFYADKWQLPDLHFDTWNNGLDHAFHEFEAVEYTFEFDQLFSLKSFMTLLHA